MWLAIREEGYKNSVKNNNYEIQEKKKNIIWEIIGE